MSGVTSFDSSSGGSGTLLVRGASLVGSVPECRFTFSGSFILLSLGFLAVFCPVR